MENLGRRWPRHFAQAIQNAKKIIEGLEVRRSSGNVYADLGLPYAEKLNIKTGLVVEIRKQCSLGLNQQMVVARMGIA